jgi:hypothetical protein
MAAKKRKRRKMECGESTLKSGRELVSAFVYFAFYRGHQIRKFFRDNALVVHSLQTYG